MSSDDPRFIALRNFIQEKVLQRISARWSTMRNLMQIDQRLLTEEIQDWYDKLNTRDQEKASSFLKRLSKIDLPEEDAQNYALIIFNHLNRLKKVKGLVSRSDKAFIDELNSFEPANTSTSTSSEQKEAGKEGPSGSSTETKPDQSNNSSESEGQAQTDRKKEETGSEDTDKQTITGNQTEADKKQSETQSDQTSESQTISVDSSVPPVFDFPEGIEPTVGATFRKTSPPERERENLFKEIKNTIESSKMPVDLKEIAIYDLRQAYWAYSIGAFKASCIMLGAVLEGSMISVITNRGILTKLRETRGVPKILQDCGISNLSVVIEEVANRIQKKFTFEDYKSVIVTLMQDSGETDKSKINEVQVFRNIIHPLKIISGVDAYKDVDSTRALNLLSSMTILCKTITKLLIIYVSQ